MMYIGKDANSRIGASEINISCVIEEKDAIRAMNVLHTHLFTYQDI
jgi:aspartate kinase